MFSSSQNDSKSTLIFFSFSKYDLVDVDSDSVAPYFFTSQTFPIKVHGGVKVSMMLKTIKSYSKTGFAVASERTQSES
jgi:hypothetical protein